MTTLNAPSFATLLERAVSEPGIISRAYTAFHGYSIGNRLLAMMQCAERDIMPGPIATFVGWKDKGRYVVKGSKAIVLCMPVTCKARKADADAPGGNDDQPSATFTRFVYRPNWFVLAQTEGDAIEPLSLPEWNAATALSTLNITEETFSHLDGNAQGYAHHRAIAVSPVAALPHKTRFHELAHVVLGHTAEAETTLSDDDRTPRNIREVEAEAVALVCIESLGLPGADESRGYIQAWNHGNEPISERSAQRIFKAADSILRAGMPTVDAKGME